MDTLETTLFVKSKNKEMANVTGMKEMKCEGLGNRYLKSAIRIIKNKGIAIKCDSELLSLAVSSKFIAVGHKDNIIRVWSGEEYQDWFNLLGQTGSLTSLNFSHDSLRLASSSTDSMIRMWDLMNRGLIASVKAQDSAVNEITYGLCGQVLFSGGADGIIKVWDSGNLTLRKALVGNSGSVTKLKSLDIDNIVSLSVSSIEKWNIEQEKISYGFRDSYREIVTMSVCPSAKIIACLLNNDEVKILNENLEVVKSFYCRQANPYIISLSHSGSNLVIASETYFSIWDVTKMARMTVDIFRAKAITALFTRDDNSIAYGCANGSVHLYTLTKKRPFYYVMCNEAINSTSFNTDNTHLAISTSNTLGLFEINSHSEPIFTITNNSSSITAVTFLKTSDILYTTSSGELHIWNILNNKLIHKESPFNEPIICISLSANNDFLVMNSKSAIKIFDFSSFLVCRKLNCVSEIGCITVSPLDDSIICGCRDRLLRVWNSTQDEEAFVLKGHRGRITCLSSNKDGTYLGSGSSDQSIGIWNFKTKLLEFSLTGHTNWITSIAFSPDNQYIVSGSRDQLVKVWGFSTRAEAFTLSGHLDVITQVSYSPNGRYISSCSGDSSAKLWRIESDTFQFELKGHQNSVYELACSTDNRFLTSSSSDYTAKVWDLKTMTEILSIRHFESEMYSISLSPDNIYLACGHLNNKIVIWKLSSNEFHGVLLGHTGSVIHVAFSPNGQKLISGSYDQTIKLWDFSTMKLEATFTGHTRYVRNIAFFLDGEKFISGSDDKSIKIWDLSTFKNLTTLRGHTNSVLGVRPSPNGAYIASCSADKLIKLWNVQCLQEEFMLVGHQESVLCVAFSNCGNFLASGSDDFCVKLWNLRERREELHLSGHTSSVNGLIFTHDGMSLTSSSSDKTIKLWDVSEILQNKVDVQNAVMPIQHLCRMHKPETDFLNLISSIGRYCYELVSAKSLNLIVTEYHFSGLHFFASLGIHKPLEAFANTNELIIQSDKFGHSPLYYSIMKQHQRFTDTLLTYLINLSSTPSSMTYISSFYAIRNDLITIIENSSQLLPDLLSTCMIYDPEKLYLGNPISSVPMIKYQDSQFVDIQNFCIKNQSKRSGKEKPLIFKKCEFTIPTEIGSEAGLELVIALYMCRNEDIFRTEFIQNLTRGIWNDSKVWVFFYTTLIWSNLLLIVLILYLNEYKLWFICVLVLINFVLLLWEVFQIIQTRSRYFCDLWNFIDIFRLALTIYWVISLLTDLDFSYCLWFMNFFTIIRGLTGFRAFDKTRYYIKLILISINNIKFFLIIFMYTTLAFGLLEKSSDTSSSLGLQEMWIEPFGLVSGQENNFNSKVFDLKYLSMMFAVVINLILMLNMIISILGDAFDEFQLKSQIYDYKEILEMLIEIGYIKSLFRPAPVFQYLHTCNYAYSDSNAIWEGKLVSTYNRIENSQKSIEKSISYLISQLQTSALNPQLLESQLELNSKLSDLDSKMTANNILIEQKLSLICEKFSLTST